MLEKMVNNDNFTKIRNVPKKKINTLYKNFQTKYEISCCG